MTPTGAGEPPRGDGVVVRPIAEGDAVAWAAMRQRLWPSPPGEHAGEVAAYFAGRLANPEEVFVAALGGRLVGFIEVFRRNAADACTTSPVAYVEGWYVEPEARRQGVGAALVRAAEGWGRARGCAEMGSDAEAENAVSIAAHRALGFEVTTRAVLFRKAL